MTAKKSMKVFARISVLLASLVVQERCHRVSTATLSHDVLFDAKKASDVPTFFVAFGNTNDKPVKLIYFPLRGLADLPLMMLELTDTAYEAEYVSFPDFHGGIKQSLQFGRLPVLHGAGGTYIAQSGAIVRALARSLGLDGATPFETAQVDMWFETVNELFKHHSRWGKAFDAGALAKAVGEILNVGADISVFKSTKTFRETTNSASDGIVARSLMVLNTFEAAFDADRETLYLVGGNVTYADLALFCQLDALAEEFPTWSEAIKRENDDEVLLAGYPRLAQFKQHIESIPQIARYLASHRRMPRVKRRDGEYYFVESVRGRPTERMHDGSEL
eukprot:m.205919 g.205919  ORF g.205919 m.205919 type:complete len:333 (+) comp18886_c1_seq8:161-1159(+)